MPTSVKEAVEKLRRLECSMCEYTNVCMRGREIHDAQAGYWCCEKGALHTAAGIIQKLASELEQTKQERDATVQDIYMTCMCDVCTRSCKYDKPNPYCECADFEWRGPCAENGGAEDA